MLPHLLNNIMLDVLVILLVFVFSFGLFIFAANFAAFFTYGRLGSDEKIEDALIEMQPTYKDFSSLDSKTKMIYGKNGYMVRLPRLIIFAKYYISCKSTSVMIPRWSKYRKAFDNMWNSLPDYERHIINLKRKSYLGENKKY